MTFTMATQVHEQSAPGFKSELDLFSVPPTQVATESGRWSTIRLSNPVTDTGPYKFTVPRDSMMLDLNKNFLYIKLKLVNGDGSRVTDEEPQVAPINYLAASFFKQVIVKVGDKEVYNSGSFYMYQAYLETLLNFGIEAKECQLGGGMWEKDEAEKHDSPNNGGFITRGKRVLKSKEFELVAPIHCDVFSQERYMLSNIPLTIELYRNDDAFCLISSADNPSYKLSVVDMCWYVRKVKPQNSLALAIETLMREQGVLAKYPIRRVKMVNRHIPMGAMSVNETNVFNGQLPRRIIFGLVTSQAFNGAYEVSPFNFRNFGVSEVCVWVGDQQYGPLRMNYSNDLYSLPYEMLFQETNFARDNKGNAISYKDYKDGCCLYAFDLTPDNSDTSALQLLREGSVNIDIRFKSSINHALGVELIVYGEFDNLLTVDWNRNIFFDYSI